MSGSGACGQKNAKNGFLTTYTYDVLNNLIQAIQHGSGTSQTRTYTYDGLGRITSEINPENGTTSYVYDSIGSGNCAGTYNGDLIKRVDAVGNVTCYTYDALHRVKDITYPTGSYAATTAQKHYVYDTATVNGATMPNAKGRLAEAYTGTSGSKITDLGFGYSVRGEATDVYESTPHSGGYYHTTVGYFENAAVKTLTGIPGQTGFAYGVDGEGRPATAVQGSTTLTSATTFNNASQPLSVTLGLGDSDSYVYDPSTGRMTSYTFTVGSTPKSMAGTLTWNPNGTLSKQVITDGFNSGGAQTCKYGDPSTSVPGYDDLGRLIKVDCGASVWQQNFSFDAFGNLTKSVPTGGTGIAWNPGYNAATNRYTLTGTSYDSNGNLLTDTFHTYTWDAEAHPATVDSSTCGTNGTCVTYDALGRMTEKNIAGVYSEVLYSPLGKTAVLNGSSIIDVYVPLPGGDTFHMVPGGQHFWHPDGLGSNRLSSSLQNRTVIYDRAFAPFGEVYKNFGSTANNNFTGDTQDTIAGTYDTPFREMNPSQGRWISPDPGGIGVIDTASPQTWNRYAYVANQPLTAVDPTGLLMDLVSPFEGGGGGDEGGWWDPNGGDFGAQNQGPPDQSSGYGGSGSGADLARCGADPVCISRGGVGSLNDPIANGYDPNNATYVGNGKYKIQNPNPPGQLTFNCDGDTSQVTCLPDAYTVKWLQNSDQAAQVHLRNLGQQGLETTLDLPPLKGLEKVVMVFDGTKQPLYNIMTSTALFSTGGLLLVGPWALAPEVCFGSGGLACGVYIYGAVHVSVGGYVLLKGGWDFTKSVTIPSVINFFKR